MEKIVNLQIKKLPEGVYLATSKDVQGLVVQADTFAEVIEYAHAATKTLLQFQAERKQMPRPINL